jgi:hypothetical protein
MQPSPHHEAPEPSIGQPTATSDISEMSRERIIARYREVRAITKQHHHGAYAFMSVSYMQDCARRLGLLVDGKIVADEQELEIICDLALHTAPPGRSTALDRYANRMSFETRSDEAIVLAAMRRSKVAIWLLESRHPIAGVVIRNPLTHQVLRLMDLGMESSFVQPGSLAMRLRIFDEFAMTSGVSVPVGEYEFEDAFSDVGQRIKGPPEDVIGDRRFVAALYRNAIQSGALSRVHHQDVPAA